MNTFAQQFKKRRNSMCYKHSANAIYQKKNDVMEQILRIKFKDNADLKQLLLDSGNCVLAEAGRDSHWAVGLSINRDDIFDTKKWRGQNWLGKLLASIRLELSA